MNTARKSQLEKSIARSIESARKRFLDESALQEKTYTVVLPEWKSQAIGGFLSNDQIRELNEAKDRSKNNKSEEAKNVFEVKVKAEPIYAENHPHSEEEINSGINKLRLQTSKLANKLANIVYSSDDVSNEGLTRTIKKEVAASVFGYSKFFGRKIDDALTEEQLAFIDTVATEIASLRGKRFTPERDDLDSAVAPAEQAKEANPKSDRLIITKVSEKPVVEVKRIESPLNIEGNNYRQPDGSPVEVLKVEIHPLRGEIELQAHNLFEKRSGGKELNDSRGAVIFLEQLDIIIKKTSEIHGEEGRKELGELVKKIVTFTGNLDCFTIKKDAIDSSIEAFLNNTSSKNAYNDLLSERVYPGGRSDDLTTLNGTANAILNLFNREHDKHHSIGKYRVIG